MRRSAAVLLALTMVLFLGCSDDTDPPKPDGDGSVTDGPITNTEGGGQVTETTIEQIRTGVIKEGTKVRLKDVIVSAVDGYPPYTGDLHVQDGEQAAKNKAIKLFKNTRTDGGQIGDLSPGDHVKVEGTVKYWTGPVSSPFKNGKYVMELDDNQVTRLAGGTPPTPADVTPADITTGPDAEAWESALLKVTNVKVKTLPDPQYGDFDVTGGLAIDDDLYPHGPTVGDCLTVTGVSVFLYEYRLNPRTAADVEAATNCAAVQAVSIKDIQDTSSANHVAKGTEVKVTGIITAVDANPSASGKFGGFFIQEGTGPHSGVFVYHSFDSAAAQKPQVGEEVELTATVDEFYDLTELKSASWTVLGTQTVPAPAVLNAADIATGGSQSEQYEGVLVQVSNFKVDEILKDSKSKDVAVKDTTSKLVVDYELFNFFPQTVGTVFTTVTGPLTYTFNEFRVLPRDAGDMVKQ